jgi:hypothetical protein
MVERLVEMLAEHLAEFLAVFLEAGCPAVARTPGAVVIDVAVSLVIAAAARLAVSLPVVPKTNACPAVVRLACEFPHLADPPVEPWNISQATRFARDDDPSPPPELPRVEGLVEIQI